MFKFRAVRLAALVLVVTGAAIFISCQEKEAPTGFVLSETDEDPAFYGYVYNALTEEPINNATVKWECKNHDPWVLLGQTSTGLGGESGYYEIGPEPWFSMHSEHSLRGTASKSGFDDAIDESITSYDFERSYEVDFYLYPSK